MQVDCGSSLLLHNLISHILTHLSLTRFDQRTTVDQVLSGIWVLDHSQHRGDTDTVAEVLEWKRYSGVAEVVHEGFPPPESVQ